MFEIEMEMPTLPKTAAERAAKYRANCHSQGRRAKSGKGKSSSKWSKAEFIALDGEGVNVGDQELFTVGGDGSVYAAQAHHYTLLAASSGQALYDGGRRLRTEACIEWLLDLGADYPKAIFVIFAGGYDINHILMWGFEKDTLQKISRGEEHQYDVGEETYSIEFRARKSLTLRRGKQWVQDKHGKTHVRWREKIIIWDTFGFFQESFVAVMAKWLGTDHRYYELIKDMKKRRGDFANVAQATINAYNAAELECLVELMQKVHGAIEGLGLKVQRWDGAGSIAAAMFRKHEIKQFKSSREDADRFPEPVMLASRMAYAGGRIEICKTGCHHGEVFDNDINSAYPSVMQSVPCLAHGVWRHGTTKIPPTGFTLLHLRYNFNSDEPFYPLFFRTKMMQISFPSDGEGWYWYPEYEAALLCAGNLEVLEWWSFEPACDHRPFHWIEGYYETRKQWLKNPTEEWQKGGEKIIKLGTNSLYGKTAQQLGGTETEPPTYHQLEWAGYITSETRARLYTLAKTNPASIIAFATDGLLSTKPLVAQNSLKNGSKIFGAWEEKLPRPLGMTMVMAGVYWFHRDHNKYDHFSRGFDKDAMKTPELIHEAWKKQKSTIDIPMHRLIGMGSACTSETLWAMRGRFASGVRQLRLDGYSHKRKPCDVAHDKPHRQLVDLDVKPNAEYGYGTQEMSFPYPLKWACSTGEKDGFENDLEIARENDDTNNI